jgi:tetratricopeptide (TPR) repeat protein
VAFSPDGERLIASGVFGGATEGYKVWGTTKSSQDKQVAREQLLKADSENACRLQQRPEEPAVWLQRGRTSAAGGSWAEAVSHYARAIDLARNDPELWYEYASVLAFTGDAEGYRQACMSLLECVGPNPQPRPAYLAARACLLTPDAGAASARVLHLAERAVQAEPNTAWYLHTLSLAYYRAGRFQRAIEMAEASLESNPRWEPFVLNWLMLAMAHHHLQHAGEARQWLIMASDWMHRSTGKGPADALPQLQMTWHDKFACLLLHREAEPLMKNGWKALPAQTSSPE